MKFDLHKYAGLLPHYCKIIGKEGVLGTIHAHGYFRVRIYYVTPSRRAYEVTDCWKDVIKCSSDLEIMAVIRRQIKLRESGEHV